MDSAVLETPANDSSVIGPQYAYVDKRPSIWSWELMPQSAWMSDVQLNWITPCSILTMIAIALTICWLFEHICYWLH